MEFLRCLVMLSAVVAADFESVLKSIESGETPNNFCTAPWAPFSSLKASGSIQGACLLDKSFLMFQWIGRLVSDESAAMDVLGDLKIDIPACCTKYTSSSEKAACVAEISEPYNKHVPAAAPSAISNAAPGAGYTQDSLRALCSAMVKAAGNLYAPGELVAISKQFVDACNVDNGAYCCFGSGGPGASGHGAFHAAFDAGRAAEGSISEGQAEEAPGHVTCTAHAGCKRVGFFCAVDQRNGNIHSTLCDDCSACQQDHDGIGGKCLEHCGSTAGKEQKQGTRQETAETAAAPSPGTSAGCSDHETCDGGMFCMRGEGPTPAWCEECTECHGDVDGIGGKCLARCGELARPELKHGDL